MNIECSQCHQRIPVRLQFLPGNRIEIECPACHDLLRIDVDDLEKVRLEDTHPILRVDPDKPVSLPNAAPFSPPEPSEQPTGLHFKRFFSTALAAFVLFLVVAVFYWIRPRSSIQSAVIRSAVPENAQIQTSIVDPSGPRSVASGSTSNSQRIPHPERRSPSAREETRIEPAVGLEETYASLRPSKLSEVRERALAKAEGDSSDPWALKSAVILAYDGYRSENSKLMRAAEGGAQKAPMKLKDADYNLVQALLKLSRGDAAQAYKFAENAYAITRSNLAQAVMFYASWRISPSSVSLDKLKALRSVSGYFPAGDLLLQAYASDSKRYQEGIALARDLLKSEPKDEPLLTRLGTMFFEMKMFDEAANVFELLARQNPSNAMAKLGLARSLRKRGQLDLARRILDSLLKETQLTNLAPSRLVEMQIERGWVDVDAQRFADAVRYFEVAHRADPKNLETLRLLVSALSHSNRGNTALSLLDSLKPEYPRNARFLALAVPLQIGAKDFPGAEKNLTEILDLGGMDEDAYLWLGEIREAKGDRKSALEAYQRVLSLDASNLKAKAKAQELSDPKTP